MLAGLAALLLLAGCDTNPKARAQVKAPEQTVQPPAPKAPKGPVVTTLSERLSPRQQALAMTLLDAPLRYAPGRYSQFMEPAGKDSFPLLLGRKTGKPMAAAGVSQAGRRYLAFGTVPVTYEFEPFHKNLEELVGWLLSGEPGFVYKPGAVIATAFLGTQDKKVSSWLRRNMKDVAVVQCEVLGLKECLGAADLVVLGAEGDSAEAKGLVAVLDKKSALPVLYFHTPYWKESEFARQILASIQLRQGEAGGNYWTQDAANWASLGDMFQTRLAMNASFSQSE
ncbi:hypothetical protein B3C1_00570 [Gallaecimonas xiamenensis 3-C-1]|uniref:Immunomodulating metalloprotease N-terminal domain-containing protein n=1 Tax=Gallaecimonas xiamenensis 3-C-1 TaxID=745411 RepID=K2JRA1_9GAMM|nr:hypothetical protein B3C1_00570 [Gallaecimonas xiamenensis 3-C-1]